jgi:hypothetical protein
MGSTIHAGGIHPLAGKAPWHSNEGLPNMS